MKCAMAIGLSLLLVVTACGCQKSIKGGGPAGGQGFSINVPNLAVDIKQGETKTVNVTVKRGDYFKQDVQLTVVPPNELQIQPTQAMVRASDPGTVSLQITAPQDAPLGKYRVRVSGQPQSGASAESAFTVEVKSPTK